MRRLKIISTWNRPASSAYSWGAEKAPFHGLRGTREGSPSSQGHPAILEGCLFPVYSRHLQSVGFLGTQAHAWISLLFCLLDVAVLPAPSPAHRASGLAAGIWQVAGGGPRRWPLPACMRAEHTHNLGAR